MKHTRNAKRFARMFLSSVGMDAADKALKELAVAAALMGKSADFRRLMVSPTFTKDDREKALKALAPTLGFSDATVRFMVFLSGERATEAVGDVLNKGIAIYAEKKGRVTAGVTTSAPLGAAEQDRVKASLKKMTGKEVDLTFSTDPSLIGGVLVKVGSRMFDSSVRGQLRLLRQELTKA